MGDEICCHCVFSKRSGYDGGDSVLNGDGLCVGDGAEVAVAQVGTPRLGDESNDGSRAGKQGGHDDGGGGAG